MPEARRQPEPVKPKRPIYTLETTGLLIIALLVLIVTVIRYWHHVVWSAR
jgi:hypothetical protein